MPRPRGWEGDLVMGFGGGGGGCLCCVLSPVVSASPSGQLPEATSGAVVAMSLNRHHHSGYLRRGCL